MKAKSSGIFKTGIIITGQSVLWTHLMVTDDNILKNFKIFSSLWIIKRDHIMPNNKQRNIIYITAWKLVIQHGIHMCTSELFDQTDHCKIVEFPTELRLKSFWIKVQTILKKMLVFFHIKRSFCYQLTLVVKCPLHVVSFHPHNDYRKEVAFFNPDFTEEETEEWGWWLNAKCYNLVNGRVG